MFRKFYYQKFISFDNKIRINKTKSGLKSKDFKPLESQKGLFPLAYEFFPTVTFRLILG